MPEVLNTHLQFPSMNTPALSDHSRLRVKSAASVLVQQGA